MTISSRDDFAAAEFALGTLSPVERAELTARYLREPKLEAAILEWGLLFSPLAETAPWVEPPAGILAAIEGHIREALAGMTTPCPHWQPRAIEELSGAMTIASRDDFVAADSSYAL